MKVRSHGKKVELGGKMLCSKMFSFRKWCFKFSIFHHKAEFKYPSIYDCHLNTWKSPKIYATLKFWKPWIERKIFWLLLVLTKDRNDFKTKMRLSINRNLKFKKFKIFFGNCDLKTWKKSKDAKMKSLFWNAWIF